MFIYNFKLNKKMLSISFIIISFIIILSIIVFSIYIIFFNKSKNKSNCINSNEIVEIDEKNYANILKASNENIDDYIGVKIQVTGYIYRLLDFNENQFVIARDMKLPGNSQSLIIGFLCNYKNASAFSDGAWVNVIGEIKRGYFNGDIAVLDIISIEETSKPSPLLVDPPF